MKIRSFLAWTLCFVFFFSTVCYADNSGTGWFEKGRTWLKDKTGFDIETAKETVLDWTDRISEFASEIKDNPEIQSAWNTLKDGAMQAGRTGQEAVTEAYHVVLDWWLKNGDGITGEAASVLDGLAKAAGVDQAEIAGWYSEVEDYINENKETISAGVQEAWSVIKEAGTEVGEAARETFEDACQTVLDWLETLDGKEADEAREAFGKIVNL